MVDSRQRFNQFIDFSGIRYGTARPSDFDGCMEIEGKAFLFYEAKYKTKEMPWAQQTAYTRFADAIANGGKESIVIVGQHDVEDVEMDVDFGNCYVRDYYYRGIWHKPKNQILVKDLTTNFLTYVLGLQPKPINILPFLLKVISINQHFSAQK